MTPIKIDLCPIIESVVEIRFKSNLHRDAVFGILYNAFKSEYPNVEKLPILQVPDQLREIDPNFKFKPYFSIYNENLSIQIGPDVLIISSPIPYRGWDEYSSIIIRTFKSIYTLDIGLEVTRLGVRYINFFEKDIFNDVNLSINFNDNIHISKNSLIRTEFEKNGFTNLVHIANNIDQNINSTIKNGSIIDIDTFKEYLDLDFQNKYEDELNKAHETEKELFFSLLNTEFISSLIPTYPI